MASCHLSARIVAMVIYEVNIAVNSEIHSDYEAWLKGHVEQLLKVPGFKTAKTYSRINEDEGDGSTKRLLTVHYFVESRGALQKYFETQAPELRRDAERLFGNKFVITRRILYPQN